MDAVSIMYVNEHLDTSLTNLRRTLGADEIGPTVPQLSHWPYRV